MHPWDIQQIQEFILKKVKHWSSMLVQHSAPCLSTSLFSCLISISMHTADKKSAEHVLQEQSYYARKKTTNTVLPITERQKAWSWELEMNCPLHVWNRQVREYFDHYPHTWTCLGCSSLLISLSEPNFWNGRRRSTRMRRKWRRSKKKRSRSRRSGGWWGVRSRRRRRKKTVLMSKWLLFLCMYTCELFPVSADGIANPVCESKVACVACKFP